MGQVELFSDAEVLAKPGETCAKCEHIIAVEFHSQRLFFCQAQISVGKYGKKIKKNDVSCKSFDYATEEFIPRWEGRYGGWMEGVKRDVKGPEGSNSTESAQPKAEAEKGAFSWENPSSTTP